MDRQASRAGSSRSGARNARLGERRRAARRLPSGQTRFFALQTMLLCSCVVLAAAWASQDWRYEHARHVAESAAASTAVAAPGSAEWRSWLERRSVPFALGAALLLLVVNAGQQGVRTARCLERERRRALHDPLTRLPNRRAFDRRLRKLVADRGHPASLLFVDLDGFKQLNDTLGHEAGDAALVRVAEALRAAVPPRDGVCCRWGGDEFAVLLPGTDRERAERVAARLQDALQGVVVRRAGHGAIRVSGSVGIATLRGAAPRGRRELLRVADDALTEVKRARRSARGSNKENIVEDAGATPYH